MRSAARSPTIEAFWQAIFPRKNSERTPKKGRSVSLLDIHCHVILTRDSTQAVGYIPARAFFSFLIWTPKSASVVSCAADLAASVIAGYIRFGAEHSCKMLMIPVKTTICDAEICLYQIFIHG